MLKLTATKRDSTTPVATLRAEGMIPAVCYGKEDETLAVSISAGEFERVFREAGTSALIAFSCDGEERDVLVKEVQRHPVSEDVLHIDFYAIVRGVEMEVTVPLEFIGEAPAEKAGATVSKILRELTVLTLPRNIPSHIDVDLSAVAEVGDAIQIKDLSLPEGVTVVGDVDDSVVTSSVVQDEPEEEEGPTEIDMDAIGDSEQKGKGEESEESAE